MHCESHLINGVSYPGFTHLFSKLATDPVLFDLANYRISDSIHGDLICDNMVYSRSKDSLVLLDPVPHNNFFNGPVFDFGKLSQSLQIGYELLLRDTSPVEAEIINETCIITFTDPRTVAYEELWMHVQDELAPRYLTESELRTVNFIGATNYFRRMKHQVVQCPQNALKFYAQGIRYLSEYLNFFDLDKEVYDE